MQNLLQTLLFVLRDYSKLLQLDPYQPNNNISQHHHHCQKDVYSTWKALESPGTVELKLGSLVIYEDRCLHFPSMCLNFDDLTTFFKENSAAGHPGDESKASGWDIESSCCEHALVLDSFSRFGNSRCCFFGSRLILASYTSTQICSHLHSQEFLSTSTSEP